MRKLPTLLAVPALVATLAACSSGGPAAVDGCAPAFAPGSASELVDATTDVGSAPEAEFPTPLISAGSQVSRLVEGDGAPIPAGAQVDFDATIYRGQDGAVLQQTNYDGESFARFRADDRNALHEALQCARVGERLVLTAPVADAVGEGAGGGLADDDTLVVVIDIAASYLGKANGFNQLPQDGMPTVVTAVDGTPGITVPAAEPPTELRLSTIKAGDGAVVEEGDRVVLHYSGWLWPSPGDDPSSFDSSWDSDGAPTMTAEEGQLIPGFVKAIVGAKVGSQVLAVLPPEEGYDDGETRIFVIDILGIAE